MFKLTVPPCDIAGLKSIRKLENMLSYRKYGGRTKKDMKKNMRLCCCCMFASETEEGREGQV